MIPWKSSLYAFILKRFLGPLLDKSSLEKLHQSIQVSLTDGKLSLSDVTFSQAYLRKIQSKVPMLSIRKALVGCLEVSLSIQEKEEGGSSSLAWRVMELGTSSSTGAKVSLYAKVQLSGLIIEVEPNSSPSVPMPESSPEPETEHGDSPKSMMSAYLDAALSALRLSVQLHDLQIIISSPNREPECTEGSENWIKVHVQSLVYNDVDNRANDRPEPDSDYHTVLHKSLTMGKVTILVGETVQYSHRRPSTTSAKVALLEATSTVQLLLVKYNEADEKSDPQYQQDVRIQLNRRLSVLVDQKSLSLIQGVSNSYQQAIAFQKLAMEESNEANTLKHEGLDPSSSVSDNESQASEEDLAVLDGIMKQYNEARKMAENQLVRGGLLLPAAENGEVTYDTFFDANDQSFIHYASVLRGSVMGTTVGDIVATDADTFVHTKVKLDLSQGSLKLSFGIPSFIPESSRTSSSEEYVLLSFSDFSASGAMSASACEVVASLNRLEIEDALVDTSDDVKIPRCKVGSLVRFGSESDELATAVLEAPCASLSLKYSKESTELEVNVGSVETIYKPTTLANLSEFFVGFVSNQSAGTEVAEHGLQAGSSRCVKISVSCPTLCCRAYLQVERERNWERIYERCGEPLENLPILSEPYFEILIEAISIESSSSAVDLEPILSLMCHSIAVSAVDAGDGTRVKRFPILALVGRTEVNPAIPVSIKLFTGQIQHESFFPSVPAIASFKARQVDEDEDEQIDQVLATTLDDLNVGPRSDLRVQNPEPEMVANAKGCSSTLIVSVPVLIGDVTIDELNAIYDMMERIPLPRDSVVGDGNEAQSANSGGNGKGGPKGKGMLAISFSLDKISLALHEESPAMWKGDWFSFAVEASDARFHAVLAGTPIQFRLAVHDIDLYEVNGLAVSPYPHRPSTHLDPVEELSRRCLTSSDSATSSPLVHRSHLFPPISRSSPVLLFDVILACGISRANVHFTLYDLTYRFNHHSSWMNRLRTTLSKFSSKRPGSVESKAKVEDNGRVIRLFLSLADCNCDYTSPKLFRTPARLLVRIGDFRLSSNIVLPSPSVQAFNLCIGDASVYLCSQRFDYGFEDSQTLLSRSRGSNKLNIRPPESVLRQMNYRSILMLDNADAALVVTQPDKAMSSEPSLRISLTLGTIGMFACKDSFSIFVKCLSELVDEKTALDDAALDQLRQKNAPAEIRTEEKTTNTNWEDDKSSSGKDFIDGGVYVNRGTVDAPDFLLDGYDWTTIDPQTSTSLVEAIPQGEEFAAKWFDDGTDDGTGPIVISHHFPLHPESEAISSGDMGASKLAGLHKPPPVSMRLVVHQMQFKLRLFDGYDWPELLSAEIRKLPQNKAFVIHQHHPETGEKIVVGNELMHDPDRERVKSKTERKAQLMGDLLGDAGGISDTFKDAPLPEEKGASLKKAEELRKLARRSDKYFQLAAQGVSIRLDSMKESTDHRLASCLFVKARDFFLAETISSPNPVKMVGEWFSEVDHPRDTNDGIFMMKIATWHPAVRVNSDNSIANDVCEGAIKILPLRCLMDQGAMFFVREFFQSEETKDTADLFDGRHRFPPPRFRSFRVKPFKVKVNYTPQRLDRKALRDGAFVELANLSPIDDMVLTMKGIEVVDKVGLGEVLSILVSHWIADIVQNQLIKFVTNIRPLEPITQVGETAVDMVVLPWEAFKNGESVQRTIRQCARTFASTFAFETVELGSRITEFLANTVGTVARGTIAQDPIHRNYLPSRPLEAPRGVLDTTPHAMESVARGVREANYKIIIVPYHEYQRSGASGAVRSVLRGIPVAISAPTSGAAEAISYSLLGVRNQIRPDIRREEEASRKGLRHEAHRPPNM